MGSGGSRHGGDAGDSPLSQAAPTEATESLRLTRLLQTCAYFAAAFSALLAATRFALDGPISPVGTALALAALGFALLPLAVSRGLAPQRAGMFLSAGALLALAAMAGLESGLRSEAFHWLPFVPLVAALFLGGRGALAFGASCALAVGVFAVAHAAGYHFGAPPIPREHVFIHFAAAATAPLFGAMLGVGYERSRRAAERRIESGRARLAALVGALPDAMVRLDAEGRVRDLVLPREYTGPGRAEDLIGRRTDAVFPVAEAQRLEDQVRESLERDRLTRGEYSMPASAPGRDRRVELRAVPTEGGVIGIFRDVTRRHRVEKLREEFVATVSHELRTPLTSIHGSLRLLEGGAFGELPKDVAELISVASQNSERLRRLIDDLLDLRSLDSGELSLECEPVALDEALRLAASHDEAYAQAADVTLVLAEPLPPLRALADPQRLQQVLANLISNAAKHSPAGARVELSLEAGPRSARIGVRDYGGGIPESFRARVFERFAQADSSSTRSTGGTGLGLAICRELVERMQGCIGFEDAPGGGTRFDVELPLAPDGEG